MTRAAVLLLAVAALSGCAGGPPVPDWQLAARSALDQAVAAELRGDSRIAALEFDRARRQVARTGQADQLARVELTRCAVAVASLEFGPCEAFDRLRPDSSPPERAYADYLAGRGADAAPPLPAAQRALLPAAQRELLPIAQRAVAAAPDAATAAEALGRIDDPLARLVAAGVLLQAGQASPASIALAIDTASAQGWRRPLLAWLGLQLRRAEAAGDAEAAASLRRRIGRVLGGTSP